MPVILFSSLFLLIAFVPNVFGFKWDKEMEGILMKPYNYTMGLVALLVAGTTAKSLTDCITVSLKVQTKSTLFQLCLRQSVVSYS